MRPLRPLERPADPCVTGPHEIPDQDGKSQLVWKCELCGTVSTDPAIVQGCWNCDDRILWR